MEPKLNFPPCNSALINEEKNKFTGHDGYKTAICALGVKFGDYYYEVEVLPHKTPLPFVGVQPSVRVGFTTIQEQSLLLPLGTHPRSYALS